MPAADPHNEPHTTVAIRPLALPGWSILTQHSDVGHDQLVLAAGEGPCEVLFCWLSEGENYGGAEDVGVYLEDVIDICAHVVWHVRNAIPPGCGEDGAPKPGDGDEP